MDEEPELPRLKPTSTDISSTRKRSRLSSPPFASSSDAIFSSDDNPSADNYVGHRRKQVYRGPWYAQQLQTNNGDLSMSHSSEHKPGKRKFKRQYDSGVWMGSDSSMDEIPTEVAQPINWTQQRWGRRTVEVNRRFAQSPRSPEQIASELILQYVEESKVIYDLS